MFKLPFPGAVPKKENNGQKKKKRFNAAGQNDLILEEPTRTPLAKTYSEEAFQGWSPAFEHFPATATAIIQSHHFISYLSARFPRNPIEPVFPTLGGLPPRLTRGSCLS